MIALELIEVCVRGHGDKLFPEKSQATRKKIWEARELKG